MYGIKLISGTMTVGEMFDVDVLLIDITKHGLKSQRD